MKKLIIFSACIAVLAFSSCTAYHYTARQSDIVRQNIQATPTIVDVVTDYAKRVVATSDWQNSKEDAMNECRFRAITENDIDIVVDPIFKIECKSSSSHGFKATLTGYAGYYANPRGLIEDIKTFRDVSKEDIEKYLIFHNPEVLQYLNPQSEVVNINHYTQTPAPAPAPAPAPSPTPVVEQPRPQPQPEAVQAPEPAPQKEAPVPTPKVKKRTNRYTRGRS